MANHLDPISLLPEGFSIQESPVDDSSQLPEGFTVQQPTKLPEQGLTTSDAEILGRAEFLPVAKTAEGDFVPAVPEFAVPAGRAIRDLIEGRRTAEQITGQEILNVGEVLGGIGSARTMVKSSLPGVQEAGGLGTRAIPVKPVPPAAIKEGARVAEAAQRTGVNIPRAMTMDFSGSELLPIIGKIPVIGTPLTVAAKKATQEIGKIAEQVGKSLGSRDIALAGEKAVAGIENTISTIIKNSIAEKYAAVSEFVIPKFKGQLTKTRSLADEINTENIEAAKPVSEALKFVEEALSRPGGMTYNGLKNLRTFVGENLDAPNLLPAGTSQAELKRVFGALSEDLKAVVVAAGDPKGEALRLFNIANTFTKRQSKIRKSLNKILGKDIDDEAVFERIIKAAKGKGGGIKKLAKVKNAVNKDTWNEIGSALIERLGRDKTGEFDPQQFVNGFANLSVSGKKLLFDGKHLKDLNDVVTMSKRLPALEAAKRDPGSILGFTASIGGFGAFSFFSGINPLITGFGTRILANILSKPKSTKLLANYMKFAQRFQIKGTGTALLTFSARALAEEMAKVSGDLNLVDKFEKQLLGLDLGEGPSQDINELSLQEFDTPGNFGKPSFFQQKLFESGGQA